MTQFSIELLDYLSSHFLTLAQLAEQAGLSEQTIRNHQKAGVMPGSSYKLSLQVTVDSFFGQHLETHKMAFYAKGYVQWLAEIDQLESQSDVLGYFSASYIKALKKLESEGYSAFDKVFDEDLDVHIEQQWQHFLDGTYGLCTETGMPEDIAAKELAIAEINPLIELETLDKQQRAALKNAVNLLDKASALFAPHERAQSSRGRLVDDVRQRFGWTTG